MRVRGVWILALLSLVSVLPLPKVGAQSAQFDQFIHQPNTFSSTQTFNNVKINGTCTGCGSANAITALTGGVTATGPGSAVATVASAAWSVITGTPTTFAGYGIVDTANALATAIGGQATGSGNFVRATSPALVTPDLGTPSAALLTNATGLPYLAGLTGQPTVATTTYYVCAKGAGGTCVYNGDGGTVATPSDANACTTKALPCATLAGLAALVNNKVITGVVTWQLATTAGTGTDCYRPNNTRVQFATTGTNVDTSLSIADIGGTTGTYPTAYLFLQGDTTTPGNVIITGATTCAGTTANDTDGIRFTNGAVRVRGLKVQYFKGGSNGPDNGALEFYRGTAFIEDISCTGDTTTTGTAAVAWQTEIRLGNSAQQTFTACNVVDALNLSHASFISPLGRANLNVVASSGWTPSGGIFTSNEKSHMGIDGLSLTVSGSGTVAVWFAIAHSSITWNDDSTFTSPAQTHSYNGANITRNRAFQGSYISDLCRTIGSLTCNSGNTTSILRVAQATTDSYINYLTPGTVSNGDSATAASCITINGVVNRGCTIVDMDTKPSISGCSAGTQLGGSYQGSFVSGTTGTCAVTLTLPTSAVNAWSCHTQNVTTPANPYPQTGGSQTTATFSGTTVTNDVIRWSCRGY